jgi:hypothetical protein
VIHVISPTYLPRHARPLSLPSLLPCASQRGSGDLSCSRTTISWRSSPSLTGRGSPNEWSMREEPWPKDSSRWVHRAYLSYTRPSASLPPDDQTTYAADGLSFVPDPASTLPLFALSGHPRRVPRDLRRLPQGSWRPNPPHRQVNQPTSFTPTRLDTRTSSLLRYLLILVCVSCLFLHAGFPPWFTRGDPQRLSGQ